MNFHLFCKSNNDDNKILETVYFQVQGLTYCITSITHKFSPKKNLGNNLNMKTTLHLEYKFTFSVVFKAFNILEPFSFVELT